jgi:hypothetical protein
MQIIQECGRNHGWQEVEVPSSSEEGVSYSVSLPPWERTEDEIVCECPSYEFRGRCRHQREAMNLICNWTELDGKKQTDSEYVERLCPECGSRTRFVVIEEKT